MLNRWHLLAVFLLVITGGARAETWQEDCPHVWSNNPYDWGRIQKNFTYHQSVDGWAVTPSVHQERIPLRCMGGEVRNDTLTCYHGPTIHGPEVFVTRKPVPEGASCQKSTTHCRFECTKASPPPTMERVVPRLKLPDRLQR